MRKFTTKYIESLAPGTKRTEYREQDGFVIIVYPSGTKSWQYIYTYDGKRRRMTLGRYPMLSLKEARQAHLVARSDLEKGIDPGAAKIQAKRELMLDPRVKDLLADYYDHWWFKELAASSKRNYRATFEKELVPALGNIRVKEVNSTEITRVIDKIIGRGSRIMANRARAHIQRLFNFGIMQGVIEANPCTKVLKSTKESPRSRYLSHSEIRKFWFGLDGFTCAPMLKLGLKILLLTGQRKAELCKAKWEHIDWTEQTWTLPEENTKNSKRHTVYLSTLAIELLADLRGRTGKTDYLLPAPNDFSRHVDPSSLSQVLVRDFEMLGIGEKFTPHDLRRTLASNLEMLHQPTDYIKRVLNHTLNKGVTNNYTWYDAADEVRYAMELWADKLRTLLGLDPPAFFRQDDDIIVMPDPSHLKNSHFADHRRHGSM